MEINTALLRTQQEYAEMLMVTRQTINWQIAHGKLKARKIGGKDMIYLPDNELMSEKEFAHKVAQILIKKGCFDSKYQETIECDWKPFNGIEAFCRVGYTVSFWRDEREINIFELSDYGLYDIEADELITKYNYNNVVMLIKDRLKYFLD